MQELKQSLAGIQSKIESLFSSITQELRSTESFLERQSNGLVQPLENLEKKFEAMQTKTESDSTKLLTELDKLLA